ncbi:hypothetical protein ACFL57_01355 [Candidatus Margulisiibacteriota bacterium]
MKRIILGGLLIMLFGVAAMGVPSSISYQGRLMENGVLVTGTKSFEFEILDALTGGGSLWSTADVLIECRQGIYSVELGDTNNPVTPGMLAGGVAYLEITVESETLSPRVKLTSVGFALEAGGITDGAIKDVDVAADAGIAWSKVSKSGASASDVGAMTEDADLTALAGGAVSVNVSAPPASIIVDSNGNVGIGTTADPGYILHVIGESRFEKGGERIIIDPNYDADDIWGLINSGSGMQLRLSADSNEEGDIIIGTDGNVGIGQPSPVGVLHVGTDSLVVSSNGRVGIGTTAPATMLDVVGTINASAAVIVGGDIVAATSGNIAIGTTLAPFKEIYVNEVYMSGESLYMNGELVLESGAETMQFTSSSGQNLTVQTAGSGVLQLTSGAGGTDMNAGSGGMNFTTDTSSGGDISFNSADQMEFLSSSDATIQTSGAGKDITLETLGSGSDIILHADAGNVVMDSLRVGIGEYNPDTAYTVDVVGTINAQAYAGDGSGLTSIPAGSYLAASDNDPAQAVVVDADGNVEAVGTVSANIVQANNLMMLIQDVEGYSTVGNYKNWGEF